MPGETSDRKMLGGDSSTRRANKRKAEKEKERREQVTKRFVHGQEPHPNDLVVDRGLGKIKIEEPEKEVVVKEEVDLGINSVEVTVTPVGNETSGLEATNVNAGGEVEIDSGSTNIAPSQDEGSQKEQEEEIGNHEDENALKHLSLGFEKCSKIIANLRKENLLLKRKLEENRVEMEEMKRQNCEFQRAQNNDSVPVFDNGMNFDESHFQRADKPVNHEKELEDLTVGSEKGFSKEIENIRKENLLQKQQLEEMKQRNEELQELQKISFVKLRDVCPPAVEENNPSVVAGKVLPILCTRGYLDKLDSLLNCRVLCKTWRQEVDNYLEKSEDFRKDLEQIYTFDCTNTLRRFLETIENLRGNPFLGRIAIFDPSEELLLDLESGENDRDRTDDNVEEYWQMVCGLLEKYGEHLRSVTLTQGELRLTPLTLYKMLKACFPHLKNVKLLIIRGSYETTNITKAEKQSQANQRNLSMYISKNPLPPLPSLLHLEFGFRTPAIQNAILEVCPALTGLGSEVLLKENAKSIGKLPLKYLDLTLGTRPSDYKYLKFVPKTLTKLRLDFSNKRKNPESSKVGLSDLLKVLKRFPELRHLLLEGTICLDEEPVNGKMLQNLSVKRLELCNCYDDQKEYKGALEDLIKREGFYARIMFHFPNLRFLNIEDKRKATSTTPLDWDSYPEGFDWNFEVWDEFESLKSFRLESVYQYQHIPGESGASMNKSSVLNKDAISWCWTRSDDN